MDETHGNTQRTWQLAKVRGWEVSDGTQQPASVLIPDVWTSQIKLPLLSLKAEAMATPSLQLQLNFIATENILISAELGRHEANNTVTESFSISWGGKNPQRVNNSQHL